LRRIAPSELSTRIRGHKDSWPQGSRPLLTAVDNGSTAGIPSATMNFFFDGSMGEAA